MSKVDLTDNPFQRHIHDNSITIIIAHFMLIFSWADKESKLVIVQLGDVAWTVSSLKQATKKNLAKFPSAHLWYESETRHHPVWNRGGLGNKDQGNTKRVMSLFVIRRIILNSSETPRKLCWVVKQHGTLVGFGFYSLRPRTSFLCNYILHMHGHLFIAVSEVGSEWFWRWLLTEYVRIWKQWTLSRKKKKHVTES